MIAPFAIFRIAYQVVIMMMLKKITAANRENESPGFAPSSIELDTAKLIGILIILR